MSDDKQTKSLTGAGSPGPQARVKRVTESWISGSECRLKVRYRRESWLTGTPAEGRWYKSGVASTEAKPSTEGAKDTQEVIHQNRASRRAGIPATI